MHSTAEGLKVKNKLQTMMATDKEDINNTDYIPSYNKNYPVLKYDSRYNLPPVQIKDGQFGVTFDNTPRTFDLNQIFILDQNSVSSLNDHENLPELTKEERQNGIIYVAIPKNSPTGKIGDAYNENRPADFLVVKINKSMLVGEGVYKDKIK